VFSDILSSKPGDLHTIDTAKRHFEDYTTAMLAYYGCSIGSAKILPRREKIDLIIDTDRPPGAFYSRISPNRTYPINADTHYI
jgi:hypothetical protein